MRVTGGVAGLLAAALAAAPGVSARSLPTVESGHRPGPDALYAPPPRAPQLENAPPWKAEPILISGASAYREGEFLYQDFIHDDAGALGVKDPADPFNVGDFLFSPRTGTLTYPSDPVYANNAADLVELRVKPLEDATAFRVTLNTLIDPERTAFTIAIGRSDEPRPWPHGARVSSPAELFLTVRGDTAQLIDAATGRERTPAPSAAVDRERRQVEVRVPHAAYDPGTGRVRLAAGVGLWDRASDTYLAPAAQHSETTPGGASPTGAALFNVAFRFDEPMPDVGGTGAGVTMADAAVGAAAQATWWREQAQAQALATGDISRFSAEVDFAKLHARTSDDSGVPKTGPMNRILASRYAFGQGIDHTRTCFDIAAGGERAEKCEGRFVGQLQPYGLYVPDKPKPANGYGFTLLLHSLSANYNQYTDSKNQSQLGERGAGSLVATPAGRGPDGFYYDIAEADTFEVWADVARHYELDPDWVAVSGYSMGGFGTFQMLARWPDLFARGGVVVGTPGAAGNQLRSLRNTPVMTWSAAADELVHITGTERMTRDLTDLGLRFISDLFPTADHLTLATYDEYGPMAEFLGDHRVDRNPPHVTYVVDASEDSPRGGAIADHAYWISGLRLRDGGRPGEIDARSEAFGVGDPPVLGPAQSAGVLTGGSRAALPYVRRSQDWGPAPQSPAVDRLVVNATNLAEATIDARRARLSCAPELVLQGDPIDLRMQCTRARARASRCSRRVTVRLPRVRGRRIVRVRVVHAGRTIRRARGRNLRRISVVRPRRGAFRLKVRARTGDGRRVTMTRRFARCR